MTDMQNIKKLWDQAASEQRAFLEEELAQVGTAWETLLKNELFPMRSGQVLDIGCGTGFLSLLLAKAGFQVTGIDISGAMLSEAREMAQKCGEGENIRFMEMDISEAEFPAESFDAVVSRDASWLFQRPEIIYEQGFHFLSKKGVLLNFDANWMLPLRDEKIKKLFEEDEQTIIQNFGEFEDYYHNTEVTDVLRRLPLTEKERPLWDECVCREIGFRDTKTTFSLGEGLRHPFMALRYRQIPTFLVRAEKG